MAYNPYPQPSSHDGSVQDTSTPSPVLSSGAHREESVFYGADRNRQHLDDRSIQLSLPGLKQSWQMISRPDSRENELKKREESGLEALTVEYYQSPQQFPLQLHLPLKPSPWDQHSASPGAATSTAPRSSAEQHLPSTALQCVCCGGVLRFTGWMDGDAPDAGGLFHCKQCKEPYPWIEGTLHAWKQPDISASNRPSLVITLPLEPTSPTTPKASAQSLPEESKEHKGPSPEGKVARKVGQPSIYQPEYEPPQRSTCYPYNDLSPVAALEPGAPRAETSLPQAKPPLAGQASSSDDQPVGQPDPLTQPWTDLWNMALPLLQTFSLPRFSHTGSPPTGLWLLHSHSHSHSNSPTEVSLPPALHRAVCALLVEEESPEGSTESVRSPGAALWVAGPNPVTVTVVESTLEESSLSPSCSPLPPLNLPWHRMVATPTALPLAHGSVEWVVMDAIGGDDLTLWEETLAEVGRVLTSDGYVVVGDMPLGLCQPEFLEPFGFECLHWKDVCPPPPWPSTWSKLWAGLAGTNHADSKRLQTDTGVALLQRLPNHPPGVKSTNTHNMIDMNEALDTITPRDTTSPWGAPPFSPSALNSPNSKSIEASVPILAQSPVPIPPHPTVHRLQWAIPRQYRSLV